MLCVEGEREPEDKCLSCFGGSGEYMCVHKCKLHIQIKYLYLFAYVNICIYMFKIHTYKYLHIYICKSE